MLIILLRPRPRQTTIGDDHDDDYHDDNHDMMIINDDNDNEDNNDNNDVNDNDAAKRSC
jgi:hypothetical protein